METNSLPNSVGGPNLSREKLWWENFNAIKKHYGAPGNLTVKDLRLAGWLTYQRHEAKCLGKQQLKALENIGFKTHHCSTSNIR